MTVKYITVKGPDRLAREPFYMGIPQHERTLSRREFYDLVAGRTGYRPTAVKAVFMALAEYIRENQRRGNITFIDGVASIRNYVKGAFQGLGATGRTGVSPVPWTVHVRPMQRTGRPFSQCVADRRRGRRLDDTVARRGVMGYNYRVSQILENQERRKSMIKRDSYLSSIPDKPHAETRREQE